MRALVQNVFGIQKADFEIEGVSLFIGPNEAGKTSLLDALGHCAAGVANPDGVTKQEAVNLVYNGASSGVVYLGDEENFARWDLPAATIRTGGAAPPKLSVFAAGIEGRDVLSLSQEERADVLIRYLKARPRKVDVYAALRSIGVREDEQATALRDEGRREDEVYSLLSEGAETPWKPDQFARVIAEVTGTGPGWDDAAKRHTERARDLKGAWGRATGDRYGSSKALQWRPLNWYPALDLMTLDQAEAELEQAKDAHSKALIAQGASGGERKAKRDLAATVQTRIDEHEKALAESVRLAKAVQKAKNALDALPFPSVDDKALECPHCRGLLRVVRDLMQGDTLEAVETALKADELKRRRLERADAAGEYSRLQTEAAAADRATAVASLARRAAADAEDWLAANPEKEGRDSADAELEVASTKGMVEAAERKVGMIRKYLEAREIHHDVELETGLGEVLGPQGIRRAALVEQIGSFSRLILGPLCETAKWKPVEIVYDQSAKAIRFTYGGRWARLSKSAQFRVRTILHAAFAQIDGSHFLLVDGADILTPKQGDGRGGLFKLLRSLTIPSCVGMTENLAQDLPDFEALGWGRTYLIRDGVAAPYSKGA
jgi:hypothetical protein